MSMYRCEICDNIKDGDYDTPEQYKLGLICEACQLLVGDYRENEKAALQKEAEKSDESI